MDGNMLSNGYINCEFDSGNRLLKAGINEYVYNAEDVRIKNLCQGDVTTYTYNTNCKLSQLLQKTTNGITTKYVYGLGLIGEEKESCFKTYHFDFRGSTVAITDECGNITDTFKYDTYGKLISRTGNSFVILGYNGRDGVVTDRNGLLYMRARYYSPDMRRFINADILHGEISDSTSLNRYSYVNGNPVSFVDPFGLSKERGSSVDDSLPNFYQAVLASQFSNGGLPIVGHTVLYFLGDNGKWYSTEFNTVSSTPGLKNKKSQAQIWFEVDVDVSAFYNSQTKTFIKNPKGINYVVLNGNFNASVALAQDYFKKGFGRYNFLFHNCSDYTNEILEVAEIDGMASQISSGANWLLPSVPVLREFQMTVSSNIDSYTNMISNGLIEAGNSIRGSGFLGTIAGNTLLGMGKFIDASTNFAGNAIDYVNSYADKIVDGAKGIAATVTNGVVDGATAFAKGVARLWNKIF